ncbi:MULTISPECIES: type IV pilus modification protein PilV [unclassified Acinetobacter]|uniref:type IV pilus modification protein PilV n=1 Tax=unclassified Acinetobacter TaxID=196816 RepID=UPI0029348881|nr:MULTISPECIES: type IV pilus modification protein PilV [unclassified Acinetobacter]WOE31089.1 type IV pilus modification protein PilV [Acinetobacter sp. SAAs470]WOE39285.1 type IV pilus modification protein PilV [Acinetobacter sp. SAAs474]
MINGARQVGSSLVEVLMALLLLSAGILGFVILQYRALDALTEAESRIQAMSIARDLAEKIRINRHQIQTYQKIIHQTDIQTYPLNCFHHFCSAYQKARFDAVQLKLTAQRIGMTLNMITCPGINNGRYCVYVAWGDTAATDADGVYNCTTSAYYRTESTCVVMEIYA